MSSPSSFYKATGINTPTSVTEPLPVTNAGSSSYISTATTTVAKTGAGYLTGITVMGGTTGTITIYDNTAASGTILAAFDTTNALAHYPLNATFATGLTIVTSAATKLNVQYR